VLTHLQSQRALALFLVGSAALLATVLTNDIALFIIVPLTIAVQRLTDVPISQLVIFEALAVNVGSALTSIGNPQNLFLWQLSHTSFLHFLTGMVPLVSMLGSLLLLWMVAAFPPTPIMVRSQDTPPPINTRLLLLSLAVYGPFVVLIEWHQPLLGAAVVLLCYLLSFPAVVRQIDWVLLLVFILMFLDMRLVANLAIIQTAMQHIGLTVPSRLFLVGVVASQLISNVPAAILIAQYSPDWLLIAYAATVGGFGLVAGSLANLIALRLAQDPRLWLRFHGYSVPFLLLSGTLVYGWLRWTEATALF
jgi:Na+/H+ antiporter NhaD/arsenite permease-like protein